VAGHLGWRKSQRAFHKTVHTRGYHVGNTPGNRHGLDGGKILECLGGPGPKRDWQWPDKRGLEHPSEASRLTAGEWGLQNCHRKHPELLLHVQKVTDQWDGIVTVSPRPSGTWEGTRDRF
jgi:hypothetical protein